MMSKILLFIFFIEPYQTKAVHFNASFNDQSMKIEGDHTNSDTKTNYLFALMPEEVNRVKRAICRILLYRTYKKNEPFATAAQARSATFDEINKIIYEIYKNRPIESDKGFLIPVIEKHFITTYPFTQLRRAIRVIYIPSGEYHEKAPKSDDTTQLFSMLISTLETALIYEAEKTDILDSPTARIFLQGKTKEERFNKFLQFNSIQCCLEYSPYMVLRD
jgi:hypothetical protein